MSPLWSVRHPDLTPWLTSALYPLLSHVIVDAKHQSACMADFQYLKEPDLFWTGAILANRAQKDWQDCVLKERDFLLNLTIGIGLYDNEVANLFVEKLMQYTAVSSSLLCDHIVSLENKVTYQLVSLLT